MRPEQFNTQIGKIQSDYAKRPALLERLRKMDLI